MIEESMNTVAEEKAMANYMGISLEEMRKEYRKSMVPSKYQGYMTDFVRYMLEKLGPEDFQNYRLYGKRDSKDKINTLMEKTDYWTNREIDILPSSESTRSYDKKRAILEKIDKKSIQDFFCEYETTYFPDISQMTPFEKIDNVLAQRYNLNVIRYSMGIDNYRSLLERIGYEGYSLINQAADIKKKAESLELSTLYKSVGIAQSDLQASYVTISRTKDEREQTFLQPNRDDFEGR